MTNRPFFSIVMPTRNRANFLPFAIQSVLEQTFEDFELIVSDNWSEDQTKDVVKGFEDPRIRYVKTDSALPIDESFDFAMSHANGQFTTFLPDDDAYTVSRLKKGFEVIDETGTKLLVHKGAYYFQDKNDDGTSSDSLRLGWFSNRSTEVEAKKLIRGFYDKMPSAYYNHAVRLPGPFFYSTFPILINAFYDTETLKFLKDKFSRLIKTRSGDLYLGILFLNQLKSYVFLDAPLSITRDHPQSTTSVANSQGASDLSGTTAAEAQFQNVPFKEWTERNVYMDIILEALKDDPDGLGKEVEFNWDNYYQTCLEDLMELKGSGFSTDDRIQRLQSQAEVSNVVEKSGLQGSVQNAIHTVAQTSPMIRLRFLISNKPDFLHARSLRLNGPRNEDDILRYSRLLDEEFMSRFSTFWLSKTKPVPRDWQLV